MKIIVTGSVGTGKTTIAKALATKYKLKYIDVNKIIKKFKLGKYNKKLDTLGVDVDKLGKVLIKIIKKNKNLVIDSHLSHYLDKKYVDLCIVCRCDLKELKRRLVKRKYSKEKINENMEAEIMSVCLEEAKEKGHRIKVVDTSRGFRKLLGLI